MRSPREPPTDALGMGAVVAAAGVWYALAAGPAAGSAQDAAPKPAARGTDPAAATDDAQRARWVALRGEFLRIAMPMLTADRPSKPTAIEDQLNAAKAEGEYKRAKTDREVAEINLTGFGEKIAVHELKESKARIAHARASVKGAEVRLERDHLARRQIADALTKKGDVASPEDIAAKLTVDHTVEDDDEKLGLAKSILEQAESELDVLTKFDHKRRTLELKAAIEGARSVELAKEAEWKAAELKGRRSPAAPEPPGPVSRVGRPARCWPKPCGRRGRSRPGSVRGPSSRRFWTASRPASATPAASSGRRRRRGRPTGSGASPVPS